MAGHFEATPGGGAAVALDEVEIAILRSLAVQLLELIGPGDEPAEGEDPLAALFAEGPSEPPSDPALARLFPEAYGDEVRLRIAALPQHTFSGRVSSIAAAPSNTGSDVRFPVRAVVANAGIAGPTTPLHEMSLADWRETVATDLDGVFLTFRAFIPVTLPIKPA